MKLLFIFSSVQRGGAEEYALTIASAAVKEGWDVYAAFPETDKTASLIKDFIGQGIHYRRLRIDEIPVLSIQEIAVMTEMVFPVLIALILPRLKTLINKFFQFFRTLFLLLELQPDAVFITLPWADFCFGSIIACSVLKIPTTVVFQLVPWKIALSNWQQAAYRWANAQNQQWIAISENNRKFISETFSIPHDQILRIYNGASISSSLVSSDDINHLRRQICCELGLPEKNRIVLTVARLHPQKGHKYLISAIPHIVKDFPEIKFVWVGDGEAKDELVALLQEYRVADKVLFLGHRSDIPRLLQSADLFVFPTYYEGQPFALLEAMAYGLPVVASATSGIPEVIEDRVHGVLFRTGDSCDLLEQLRWALSHPDAMQEMAKKAQVRVQEFSEAAMIKETLTTLCKLSCNA